MYSLRDIVKGLKHPQLVARELNRLFYTKGNKTYNKRGTDIFEEDWDNLLILDACRLDMFRDQIEVEGHLESRTSRGSSTIEFLRGNFDGRQFLDTIYLTANPQFEWNRNQIDSEFYKTINLWNREQYWDSEYNTVKPEKVTEKAIEISEKFPDKRLIVHYMQPHYPFLPEGGEVEKMELDDHFWHMKMRRNSDTLKEKIWRMYEDNLSRALNSVEEFVGASKGLTVITSDHGNFVGERASPIPVREWGHPIGIYDSTLVEIPWFVVENGSSRKRITSGEKRERSQKISEEDEEKVKEKLKGLGYME